MHRSEGFGFGPAEAMALGKAILATNWSGNTDYMRPDNCLPIGYTLVSLEENYGPYKKGQIWAEPDVQQAAQAMQSLLADRTLAHTRTPRPRNDRSGILAAGRWPHDAQAIAGNPRPACQAALNQEF
ncbi:MAG: glycosyltransferase [Pseudomonadales bacterium]|nr:glycosyltransferase [Pseudomonadales bacterium]